MLFRRWHDREHGAPMIALTPLTSWLLLITIGVAGAAIALVVARAFDAADDRRSMEQWHKMTNALDLFDWEEHEEHDG